MRKKRSLCEFPRLLSSPEERRDSAGSHRSVAAGVEGDRQLLTDTNFENDLEG